MEKYTVSDKIYEIGNMLGLEQNDINNLANNSVYKTANYSSPIDHYKGWILYGTVSINHFK